MSTMELAWFNYEQANKRIDRCKQANDATGLMIAESSADHWHKEWQKAAEAVLFAEESSMESPANASPADGSSTATAVSNVN